MSRCAWCERPINGRHRIAEPFALRGWVRPPGERWQPKLLNVPVIFHRQCWADVRRIAGAAERAVSDGLAADLDLDLLDPPMARCECGVLMYAGVDHACAGVMPTR